MYAQSTPGTTAVQHNPPESKEGKAHEMDFLRHCASPSISLLWRRLSHFDFELKVQAHLFPKILNCFFLFLQGSFSRREAGEALVAVCGGKHGCATTTLGTHTTSSSFLPAACCAFGRVWMETMLMLEASRLRKAVRSLKVPFCPHS